MQFHFRLEKEHPRRYDPAVTFIMDFPAVDIFQHGVEKHETRLRVTSRVARLD